MGRPRMPAPHAALHPGTALGGSGGPATHSTRCRHDGRTHGHQTRGAGIGGRTQMPRGGSSRRPGALPRPGDGTAPSSKAHRCWSSGTAPRCRSCGGPGPEGPGQRALPRCKAVPSRRQGGRREDAPRGLSSWLAQEALERGVAVSPTAGHGGEAPPLKGACMSPHLPENPSTLAEH